jgi:DNA-damage-inducible protein D
MVTTGSGDQRQIQDYLLTRYACYLVAQNGDPRKFEIVQAQTYFAIQTRKQELNEQYIEESKRHDSRAKLKETERKIDSSVYKRGIRPESLKPQEDLKKVVSLRKELTIE